MPTPLQLQNIAKLALYVNGLPENYEHFDMMSFAHIPTGGFLHGFLHEVVMIDTCECGTTACFAGHGPHAGIAPKEGENWDSYCSRAFGASSYSGGGGGGYDDYLWLFDANWPSNPHQAAKRAAWLLQGGELGRPKATPKGFEFYTPNWDKVRAIAHGSLQ